MNEAPSFLSGRTWHNPKALDGRAEIQALALGQGMGSHVRADGDPRSLIPDPLPATDH